MLTLGKGELGGSGGSNSSQSTALPRGGSNPSQSTTLARGGNPEVSSTEGGSSATTTPVSAFAEPQFEDIRLVTELAIDNDSVSDENPTLTTDQLEIFFNSNRDGGTGSDDVWFARRDNVNEPFSSPIAVNSVNTDKSESSPAIAADGLTLWVGVERDGGRGGRDIWRFERASRSDEFEAPQLEDVLSTSADDIPRPLGNAETTMPLASRIDGGTYQTYFASRNSSSKSFEAPALIAELVKDSNRLSDAFLTDDGCTLYFVVSGDIYVSHRETVTDEFAATLALSTINSKSDDRDPFLTADGRLLYFVSDRDGRTQIYRATLKSSL